jgi:hypothetical protein
MTVELRLGPLRKSSMVKLTVALPQELKTDLDRYAELHSARWGEPIDAVALIPHMLDAFVARDRGFRKARPPSRPSRIPDQFKK